ncbi:snRNA-activating protein complex subunit 3 [Brienomyrus brachyistius]|uniref:snRNA-activating protein complex subunit 3 n=1 Tax=Brienomyrus brachyistius TaxID=42636 RepID=UPI0020B3EE3F|nr:snRNA-activating protein complex subunit 3 [Brienomyrus brachyistius]
MAEAGGHVGGSEDENVPTYENVDVNSKIFRVGGFGRLWTEKLRPSDLSFQDGDEDAEDAAFALDMGITPQTMSEIKEICSPSTLKSGTETAQTELVPAEPILRTLRLRKRRQDYQETLQRDFSDRQNMHASELEGLAAGKKPMDPKYLVPEGEIILSVNVLYPAIFQRFRFTRQHQTLRVLGSQKLTQLRDAICCVSDLQVSGEFSSTPDMVPEFISKDLYKSAFFFFEGVFYNDLRYPECIDLSKTIVDWTKSHDFPPFQSRKMEETSFSDLRLKVGYPYLYCHQGDCEHVVLIADVRMAHQDDCLDMNLYPLLAYKHRVKTRKCSVCHMYISRWITTNDSLAPMDPCLFCEQCFRLLHYDKQGNKLCNFLAYPYVDPGAFN